MVITGLTRNSPSLRRFRPHKTLDSSGFQNIKIEYFFLFSTVVLSKSFLNKKLQFRKYTESYRSGHNELDSKSSCEWNRTRVRIPHSPPPKKPVIKPISGFFLFAFLRASGQSLQHFWLTLIWGTVAPSTRETACFWQLQPAFHCLCRGDFCTVIKMSINICSRWKIRVT